RSQRFCQGRAQLAIADQEIAAVTGAFADFEGRRFGADEAAHVEDRLKLVRSHHAEWDDGVRMAVHNRDDVGADAIDFTVDEAFEIDRPAGSSERIAVEIEFQNIRGGY